MIERDQIAENYLTVMSLISEAARRSGRSEQDVKLLVVTKGHSPDAIRTVISAGACRLGENYVEAAAPKIEQITPRAGIEWHMIGHIQSRKARQVCELFDYVHSLDSLKLAEKLNHFAGDLGIRLPVLLECNVSGEESKFGFPVWRQANLPPFFETVAELVKLDRLDLRGLMTMAPFFDDPEKARPSFQRLKTLQNQLSLRFPGTDWSELSMGMSTDYQIAIEEGATFVRIGTAILGTRVGA